MPIRAIKDSVDEKKMVPILMLKRKSGMLNVCVLQNTASCYIKWQGLTLWYIKHIIANVGAQTAKDDY